MKKVSLLFLIAIFAVISCQAQTKQPAHTFANLPYYAQASLLNQRAAEYHTAGDIITISGAVVALSALQSSGTKTDRTARVIVGAGVIALGRLIHLVGTHSQKKANRIRFTGSGLSLNF
ncbi:MAG TPA: hypothetical protein VFX43_08090 [Chitinophagaceae bacterium]|nr:hypothetical protein [Chitinophagaceae bacterium]